jgi:hypothetical protein
MSSQDEQDFANAAIRIQNMVMSGVTVMFSRDEAGYIIVGKSGATRVGVGCSISEAITDLTNKLCSSNAYREKG